jgi:hypothetical protein
MNSDTSSKCTCVYSDSNSDHLIGLPVLDGKKWNKGWDDIANDRLEKDLFNMVDADIPASLQGATMVTKMPALAKHDATAVTAMMTPLSTAAARKAEKGVNANLCPSFKKTRKPSSLCLDKDAKKSAPAENTKKRNNIKTTVCMKHYYKHTNNSDSRY